MIAAVRYDGADGERFPDIAPARAVACTARARRRVPRRLESLAGHGPTVHP